MTTLKKGDIFRTDPRITGDRGSKLHEVFKVRKTGRICYDDGVYEGEFSPEACILVCRKKDREDLK